MLVAGRLVVFMTALARLDLLTLVDLSVAGNRREGRQKVARGTMYGSRSRYKYCSTLGNNARPLWCTAERKVNLAARGAKRGSDVGPRAGRVSLLAVKLRTRVSDSYARARYSNRFRSCEQLGPRRRDFFMVPLVVAIACS